MSAPDYVKLADELAADIAAGRLKAGDRLPPQRNFAYDRKIAVSTASRVYSELLRRGLTVGEVGRGTFISGRSGKGADAAREPGDARIDLEFNYPLISEQPELIAKSLAGWSSQQMQAALPPTTSTSTPAMRELSAGFLARNGWSPSPHEMLFTGSGRQSIAAAVGALVPTGGRCGVETLTYPFIKGIAARLGVTLVPLAMDGDGVRPDAIAKTHREAHLSAVYLQPAVHNPLGITAPPGRRADIVQIAEKLDLTIIDDSVYGFLGDEPPLAALAPERCVVLDSMSKRVAPGLTLGFIHAPMRLREALMASIRSGGWAASGFASAAAAGFMSDGTAAELVTRKRKDARERQQIAAECLADFTVQADPRSYHLWLTLPEHWRSQAFAAAAARRGIALTPSSAFAVTPGHAPNAIRLGLGSPPRERLRGALESLARILAASEVDFDYTE